MYNKHYYGNKILKNYQVNIGKPLSIKNQKEEIFEEDDFDYEEAVTLEKSGDTIIEDAQQEAERIISEATAQAEELLNSAGEKIEKHMIEVEQAAKEEGYKNGEEMARLHYQNLIDEAEKLRNSALVDYENKMKSLEPDIIRLVLEISQKVISYEINTNNEAILGIVKKTLESVTTKEKIILRVSPEDYDFIIENEKEIFMSYDDIKELDIRKDNKLEKGSCIAESSSGSVDGGFKTQYQLIEKAFKKAVGSK